MKMYHIQSELYELNSSLLEIARDFEFNENEIDRISELSNGENMILADDIRITRIA